jgi:hypothetical protein
MSIDKIGALVIGGVMLFVGVAILVTDIDPLALCLKQCDLPKALATILGPSLLKLLTGGVFIGIAAVFLVPAIRADKRNS